MTSRFERAIDAIDAANAADPHQITVRGRTGPKEILHAELVTEWVRDLAPDAGEELLLAARGHHLRRWTVPRASAPAGGSGYLRWRKNLHEQHATELGPILTDAGYDQTTIARVQTIVRKQGLGRDPEVQTLEDALCLVFLETQLAEIATRLGPDKLVSVIQKTAKKMSPAGLEAIARVPLDDADRARLERGRTGGAGAPLPRRTRRQAWAELGDGRADIERIGPYGDNFHGRDEYVRSCARRSRLRLRAPCRTVMRRPDHRRRARRDGGRGSRSVAHRRGDRLRRRRRFHHASPCICRSPSSADEVRPCRARMLSTNAMRARDTRRIVPTGTRHTTRPPCRRGRAAG